MFDFEPKSYSQNQSTERDGLFKMSGPRVQTFYIEKRPAYGRHFNV